MTRTLALLLTVLGAAGLYFGERAVLGLAAGLFALVAIWLVSGRPRQIWAAFSVVTWVGAAVQVERASMLAFAAVGLVGAALILVKGGQWPGFGTRFERNTERDEATPKQMWESLDRGEDPTD